MGIREILPAHGLGDTQRQLLELLKRRGRLTVSEIGAEFDLAAGTLREHLNALGSRGLVERAGTRKVGPGRPEVVYALSSAAEALFPNKEGELLAALVRYLLATGKAAALEGFFAERVAARRDAAMARVAGKGGSERVAEVARILSDEGFMAEVTELEGDHPGLNLCHCPLKEAVAATHLPCRAELAFVGELLGKPLTRTTYMPDGDLTCSYQVTSQPATAPVGAFQHD